METEPAIKIMRALANGHDPATGDPLQAGNLCLSAENVKALNCAFRIGSAGTVGEQSVLIQQSIRSSDSQRRTNGNL